MKARLPDKRLTFWLGTHKPHFLELASVPFFVSRHTLEARKTFPRARGPWALDSGGFTELHQHGRWTITPKAYVAFVRRVRDEIGNLYFCAPMDWMCEETSLRKTGKTVEQHQQLTVQNYLELRSLAPELPFIPVLQGFSRHGDYERCVDLYERRGVRLRKEPLVGVGTLCRRPDVLSIVQVLTSLTQGEGLRVHAFGVKKAGLQAVLSMPFFHHARGGGGVVSADSLAWSATARYNKPMPGHERLHSSCANCLAYALAWRERLLAGLPPREHWTPRSEGSARRRAGNAPGMPPRRRRAPRGEQLRLAGL